MRFKPFGIFIAASIPLLGFAWAASFYWSEVVSVRTTYQRAIERYWQAHLEDQASAQKFLDSPSLRTQHKDAGPYLNPRVRWDGPKEGVFPAMDQAMNAFKLRTQKTHPQELKIPDPVWNLLQKAGASFILRAGEIDFKKIPLEWFSHLDAFDGWDIFSTGPLSDLQLEATDPRPFQMGWVLPQPKFRDFQVWAKLRLMKGIQEKNFNRAQNEVRQFGRLLLTTQSLFGNLAALAVFQAEIDAVRHLDGVRPALYSHALYSIEQLRTLRRTLIAFGSFIHPWVSVEKLYEIKSKASVGYCSALVEAFQSALISRALTLASYPTYYSWLGNEFQKGAPCRLSAFQELWKYGPLQDELYWKTVMLENSSPGQASTLPFATYLTEKTPLLKAWVGQWYLAITVPSYLGLAYLRQEQDDFYAQKEQNLCAVPSREPSRKYSAIDRMLPKYRGPARSSR